MFWSVMVVFADLCVRETENKIGHESVCFGVFCQRAGFFFGYLMVRVMVVFALPCVGERKKKERLKETERDRERQREQERKVERVCV